MFEMHYCAGDKIENKEMGGACSTYEGDERRIKVMVGKPEGKRPLGRPRRRWKDNTYINPYPTAFPYGNGMVLHFYQQQESSTTKTVHKVINKGLKTYV